MNMLGGDLKLIGEGGVKYTGKKKEKSPSKGYGYSTGEKG